MYTYFNKKMLYCINNQSRYIPDKYRTLTQLSIKLFQLNVIIVNDTLTDVDRRHF